MPRTLRVAWIARCGVALLGLGAAATLAAQSDLLAARVTRARRIETGERGHGQLAGLIFSPRARSFLVLVRSKHENADSDLVEVTLDDDVGGSPTKISAQTESPVNVAFDGKANRLLIYQPSVQKLVTVAADAAGRPIHGSAASLSVRHLGLRDAQGITVDPDTGILYVLDSASLRILRIEPDVTGGFERATVSEIELSTTEGKGLEGIALDPQTGKFHIMSRADKRLFEVDENGLVVASRDLSDMDLVNPGGMVFAPSGDSTDDPTATSLYIADSGHVVELSSSPVPAPAMADFTADLVQTIDTSALVPPSPDTAGIAYLAASDTLLFSDSEVNEVPIFTGDNLWEIESDGFVVDTTTTTDFSNEPTGVAYNSANGHVFISDDNNSVMFEVRPGPDGKYGTPDDIVTSFDTSTFNSGDPEGVAFDDWQGVLFIVDGVDSEVYRVSPGANGIFDGEAPAGDDQVTSFDTEVHGVTDPEGIAFNTDNGNLYVVGQPATTVIELTNAGALVQTIDISAANAVKPAGLAYAPGSLNPSTMNIYITDRGVDNSSNPNENDGKIYEMTLPPVTPIADLSIVKSVDNPTPGVGSNVVFTITVNNSGPSNASGVAVSDPLPTGYTYVFDDGLGAYDVPSGIWTIGPLAKSAPVTLNIIATVNASGDFTNIAQISAANEPDPDPNNNQASASTSPLLLADLSMAKSVDNPTPDVGSNVVFTLTVDNGGPATASGVAVSDLLPTGYTYVFDDGLGAYDAPSGIWTIGTLANGASATLSIIATVNPSGNFVNVAQVSSANEADPSNDQASVSTAPNPPPPCSTETYNLSGETVNYPLTVIGCSITAGNGYTIANGGDVLFSAKTFIQLTNGFSVLTGGIFRAELDPAIP